MITIITANPNRFVLVETALPYTTFKDAGYEVKFATEAGKVPECDKKMLRGFTQRLLVLTSLPEASVLVDCPNQFL